MVTSMAANSIQVKSAFIVESAELGVLKSQTSTGKRLLLASYINFKTKTMKIAASGCTATLQKNF